MFNENVIIFGMLKRARERSRIVLVCICTKLREKINIMSGNLVDQIYFSARMHARTHFAFRLRKKYEIKTVIWLYNEIFACSRKVRVEQLICLNQHAWHDKCNISNIVGIWKEQISAKAKSENDVWEIL